jgi:ATP-dependent helicase/nuclease subunit A
LTPDRREREEGLDPARSFIVEAPAGSGKTSLLVQRYLRLLSIVERPEAVVAMTFTRKAATELRERVLQALEEAEIKDDLDEHKQRTRELAREVLKRDRELGWNVRGDTGRLQIQTIDSLCAMLTRQMPILSHLGGAPRVVENAAELYHLAARQTIGDLAEGDVTKRDLFRRVALHFDNDLRRVESQVARMLERREQWRAFRDSSHPENVQDFCDLLCHAEQALKSVFREAGEVDFTEITRAAIEALGGPESPSDLLYWLDYRIEHLLVDEFQDTSHSQYELLKALTGQWSEGDNRTLFVVGDPMQSIYRFREAEVGLFLQCWQEERLADVRLTPLRLVANFRSTPEIVAWTQQTFTPIMDADDRAHGGVKLRRAEATRPETGVAPRLISFVNDKGEEEARAVVELVKTSLEQGDVAILVRSRSQLASILPALARAKLRYEAIEIDQLRDEQHVLDLISLTRAILHPGDRVSWLACLRAPWCGLKLPDLSALVEREQDRTVFALLSDPEKIFGMSPDGRIRAVRVQEILSQAAANVGRLPLRDLVEKTWLALGGPAALREQSHLEDAETYFELIEEFERGGVIRDFSLLNERLEFLFAKPVSGADCVKVMTIHAAKGLEFDTVILPKLGAGARSSERDLLVWTEQIQPDGSAKLLVAAQPQRGAPDQAYELVCDELDIKEQHELKRLFYVAATRAKNRLYLIGNADANKARTGCIKAGSRTFLGLIWASVAEQFESELRRKHWHQVPLFANFGAPENVLRRLPANWHVPKLDRSVEWEPKLRRATASARKISYEWVSDTGRHVGTVVHEVLKRVAGEGVSAWSAARLATLAPFFRSELLRLGVPRSEELAASKQIGKALTITLGSERGRWILARHGEARSEWAVGGRVEDKVIAGVVDRMFRDEQGRLWIIDYKTSDHEGADVEKFLDKEQGRYRPQLENYATLIARLEKGPIVLGLYFPLLDAWREWAFEEEVGRPASYTSSSWQS